MKKIVLPFILFVLGIAALTTYLSIFTVNQAQQAMVLKFGKPQRVINSSPKVNQAGLHFKMPFIENVEYFDKRILDLDMPPKEMTAIDNKRLVIDAFTRYRIVDPLLFYQTVRTIRVVNERLANIVEASLRRVLGRADFVSIVRDRRDELMKQIASLVNDEAGNLGIEVVDVRIKRADLPEANSQAIYRRMNTERQREAAEHRANGEEKARRIRADADRQVVTIKAEATREAEQIRGDGDAERNAIYAAAFGKDPDFFAFYRSMQAYEIGLGSGESSTRLIIPPNSDFFRYFNNPMGR
jgi:membrane protease subunit HflC